MCQTIRKPPVRQVWVGTDIKMGPTKCDDVDQIWLSSGNTVDGFCEHGNEHLGEFLDCQRGLCSVELVPPD
jgi:hypothetical protein